MKTATHNGCRIKVRMSRDKFGPRPVATVNGEPFPANGLTEDELIDDIVSSLAYVHADPINGDRWPAHYYPPGTYELCDNDHPREIGGTCRHSYCVRLAAALDAS